MKRDFYTKKDAGKAVYYVLIAQLAIQLIIAFFPIVNSSTTFGFAILMIEYLLMEGVFFVVFLYYNNKNSIYGFKTIGLKKKTDIISLLLCILISFCVLLLTYHFFNYTDLIFLKMGFKKSQSFQINSYLKFIVCTVMLGVVPALFEELIYRGIVLKGLSQKGKTEAIILTSLLFALMHMGVFQFFYQFYLGVIFAVVVLFTQDIKLSMTMHFTNNFLVLLLTFLNEKIGFKWFFWSNISFVWTVLMFIGCSALIFALLYIIKKRNKTKIEYHSSIALSEVENKNSNISIFLTVGVYVFIQIIVLALTLSSAV